MFCRDPEIYCKFRSSCSIHFITKRKKGLDDQPQPRLEEAPDKNTGKINADRP
jgi:hypothetical protein